MKPGRAFVFLLLVLCSWKAETRADCIACWQLKGVRLHLTSGKELVGYALWNETWPGLVYKPSVSPETGFPEVLLKLRDVQKQHGQTNGWTFVRFYFADSLYATVYPDSGLVISTAPEFEVPLEDITQVRGEPGPFEDYEGAGYLPVVTERTTELLQTREPVASCEYHPDVGYVIYWVSYDRQIGQKHLRVLCEEPWGSVISPSHGLEARGIIGLEISYD